MSAPVTATGAAIVRVVYTSVLSSVLVSVIFAVAVVGLIRSSELRRNNASAAAFGYTVVAVAALAVCGASVVYGLILVGQKG